MISWFEFNLVSSEQGCHVSFSVSDLENECTGSALSHRIFSYIFLAKLENLEVPPDFRKIK